MTAKIPVSVLGATGTVGQKFVRLLADHPWFEVAAVAASAASAGRRYGEVVRWREQRALPGSDRRRSSSSRARRRCPGRSCSARSTPRWRARSSRRSRAAGAYVVTNTRNHRMEPDVPLLIPEANADHLALVDRQRRGRGWPGAILANPNCSTAALVLALAPLHRAFGLEKLFVSTMQAVSGAGYPGVASLDILGNVVPYIGGEEEKMERESRKILGTLGRRRRDARGLRGQRAHQPGGGGRRPPDDGVGRASGRGSRPRTPWPRCASSAASPRVACLPSSPDPPVEVDRAARPAAAAARSRARRRDGGDGGPGPPLPDPRSPAGAAGPQHRSAARRGRRCRSPSCWWPKAGWTRQRADDRRQVRRHLGGRRGGDRPADRDRPLAGSPTGRWWWCRALAGVTDALLGLAPIGARRATAPRSTRRSARCVDRHAATARELPGAGRRAAARSRTTPRRSGRELGAALGPACSRPAELDALAGRGELWSSPAGGRRRWRAPGIAADLGGHPPDHGHRRPLRPGHAVHAGARRPGARVPAGRWPRPAGSR